MGGGDLNLKKSWHPQTIRNVERVWKAEQKASAEAKKIEQLQRELMEERAREDMQRHAVEQGISKKKSDRLEWMYATPGQVDREQYLLGKAIDKHVDPLQNGDQEENVPGASFSNDANANTPADLAAKIRDDPLFLIKKKEEEKKKELITNPVKMKELRQMLQKNLGKSKKKKEKKKKKDKKSKKIRSNHSDGSSESESEDEHLRKKNRSKNVLESKQHTKNRQHRQRSISESPERPSKYRHYQSPIRNGRESRLNDRKHKRPLESPHRNEKQRDKRHYQFSDKHKRSRSRSDSESPERTLKQRHRQSSPQRSTIRQRSNDRKYRRSPSPHRHHRRSRSPEMKRRKHSPIRRKSPSPRPSSRHRGSAVTKKMSEEELEKRREEMLSNAQWRNDQRTANVKKYNETEKQEAETEVKNAGKSAQFLSAMKVQSFSSDSTSSVSDRIKRNINNLQRTTAALDTFLAKK